MTIFPIPATSAYLANPGIARRPAARAANSPWTQRGVTLVELMVGIAIGLLVVAVATSALMVSRGISGTVSDASGLHQQAAHAMRVIGQQVRQAGSLYLNLNPTGAATTDPAAPVALEVVSPGADASGNTSFNPTKDTLATQQTSDGRTILGVGYRRYPEPLFDGTTISLARNCIGEQGGAGTNDKRIESIFMLDNDGNLRCGDNPNSKPSLGFTSLPTSPGQPIIRNVANFRVRYLVQNLATLGAPQINYVEAASFNTSDLARVQGVEICLVLYGDERINLPAGSEYTDCDGSRVDMTAADLPANRRNRMHLMFRNVFQLRSQGLVGSVL